MNHFDNFLGSDAAISRRFVTPTRDKFLRNTMNHFDNFLGSDAAISWHFVTPTPDKFLHNTMNYFDNFLGSDAAISRRSSSLYTAIQLDPFAFRSVNYL
jgi:hypothetical protein